MGFNLQKTSRGLTLVELLIAILVLTLIIYVVASVLVGHLKLFNRGSALIEITSTNKIALDEIVNEVRQSESIVNNCTPCGSDTTGASLMITRLWPLDNDENPIDNGNYDYIVYKRDPADNTKLRKIVYPDATSERSASNKIIGTDIANISFTYNNPNPALATNVTIKIKNTTVVNGATQEIEREAKAVLRNK